MKKLSKLLALALALAFCLCMAPAAFAEGPSITIVNPTKDATYQAYKIFNATAVEKDGKTNIVYTASEAQKEYWEGKSSPFTFTKNTTGSWNVALTEGNDQAAVAAFFKANITSGTTFDTGIVDGPANFAEDSNGKMVVSGLGYGYYFVTSSLGTVVSVTTATPTATVVDKNTTGPTWDNGDDHKGKVVVEGANKLTTSDAAYGETVNFDIGVNAPNYVGDEIVTNYKITDTLGSGFDYVMDTTDTDKVALTVTVDGVALDKTAYTVQMTENGFDVVIPWVGEKDGKKGPLYAPDKEIHVTYSATLNKNAAIAGEGNKNTASLSYTSQPFDPDDPPKDPPTTPDWKKITEEKTTTTYTYALGIQKTDEEHQDLPGAEFTVALGNQKVVADATTITGVYEFKGYAAESESGTNFVTNANGQLIIKGVDAGTYSITETKAPDGYNALSEAATVEAKQSEVATYTQTVTKYYDEEGNVVNEEVTGGKTVTKNFTENVVYKEIVNKTGNLLPSTGGIGTTIFYVVGGLLALVAVVLLVTKKRMNNMD